ncbi:MAG TPA: class I SAM-dependent methyltransferase [Ktedonobacteraceae bacterium]|nr:class I SAM-dependent methyltransferase [Ktedonobacteraceae bacterium]
MSQFVDREYLLNDQYKDSTNFQTRVKALQHLGLDMSSWYHWIIDHIHRKPQLRLLEVGCGPGYLWQENKDRLPEDWDVTLSDFSPGMVQEAQRSLGDRNGHFHFQVIDVQAIPYEAGSFDGVIANSMLYHVPDLPRALQEIRRVLKTDGHLYATTASFTPMEELLKLTAAQAWTEGTNDFRLENATEHLAEYFAQIDEYRRENRLAVGDIGPLIATMRSMIKMSPEQDAALQQELTRATESMQQQGITAIPFTAGLFVASGSK